MFPARQLGVFAIHSTTGNRAISEFNPNPKMDENFSILSEYIESAWLTDSGTTSTRRLSGTSFATPVAVCLSAFILAYIPRILPGHENHYHKLQLRSYEGIRNVMQLMANKQTTPQGQTYQYISPQKYFRENNPLKIKADIEKALLI
jgi:hypothetical protein